uniref:receptor protein-tyrosine kinase n=1 Tax=Culicoides sonorensis TaxID=179676 RepID=A0A336M6L7_CULSO
MICNLSMFIVAAHTIIMITAAYRLADGDIPYRDVNENNNSDLNQDIRQLIEREVGSDIQINCVIKPEHLPYNKDSKVDWYFQPCTSIFCDTSYNYLEISNDSEWIKLNQSSITLHLTDLDVDRHSGLYRCSMEPYKIRADATLNIHFYMNHHLVVTDSSQIIPRILDRTPANITTSVGQTAVFHCRVQSHSFPPPLIKWYKIETNTSNKKDSHTITYHNITYDLIKSGDQKQIADTLYLSKLIFQNVTVQHTGIYGCVALNYGGFIQQEAYLHVNSPFDSTKKPQINKYFWLFFFPICLIIVPIIVYMWFYSYNKKGGNGIDPTSRSKEMENVTGSNQWVARPNNVKNPYMVVDPYVV